MNDNVKIPEEAVAPSPKKNDLKKPSRRKMIVTVVAAVLCVMLAILMWICVMHTQDTDYIPIRVITPAGLDYELSVQGVTVEGSVAALRHLDEICITVTGSEPTSYCVSAEMLELPEGVTLAENWSATLTLFEQ